MPVSLDGCKVYPQLRCHPRAGLLDDLGQHMNWQYTELTMISWRPHASYCSRTSMSLVVKPLLSFVSFDNQAVHVSIYFRWLKAAFMESTWERCNGAGSCGWDSRQSCWDVSVLPTPYPSKWGIPFCTVGLLIGIIMWPQIQWNSLELTMKASQENILWPQNNWYLAWNRIMCWSRSVQMDRIRKPVWILLWLHIASSYRTVMCALF